MRDVMDSITIRRAACVLAVVMLALSSGCRQEVRAVAAEPSASSTDTSATPSDATPPPAAATAALPENPFPRRVKAPGLEGGNGWINTAGPIELEQLKGKFVLLDFWTYCCINCMHILPEVKKLETKYPNELVVIGVHSAKFDTEKESQNITDAVMRYEIEHPVVNDSDHAIWNMYGINSWPTLLLIDPEGYAVWLKGGETTFETLDEVLAAGVAYYRRKGTLDETPLKFDLAAAKVQPTPLRYPGKVLADEAGGRLFIADSNHNRLVIAGLDGKLIDVIGSGAIGRADGDYDAASFNKPQGMFLLGETLYVADTENHLLRKIDLSAKQVATIAGTGKQARNSWPGSEKLAGALPDRWVGPPATTAINSPWALWVHGDALYIAMAGPHQIWKMPLDESEIGPYAGNGREDIVDGLLLPRQPYAATLAESQPSGYTLDPGLAPDTVKFSSFAQPSGLTSDGKQLFVADSEGSAIRAVPFAPTGRVTTLVGSPNKPYGRLFDFGDVDGPLPGARLQHALGIVYYEGKLYVADTYNNKIKVLDPTSCMTLAGDGQPAASDDPPRFDEPAGLSAAAGKLYVADTNNHLIRTIDLHNGNQVATLTIEGLEPPKKTDKPAESTPNP